MKTNKETLKLLRSKAEMCREANLNPNGWGHAVMQVPAETMLALLDDIAALSGTTVTNG